MAQPAPPSTSPESGERVDDPRPCHLPGDRLDRLADRYTFRRPEEVAEYLGRYPHLAPILLQAAEVIPGYFGADAPLVLEVFTDPEDDDPRPELFALVQTSLEPEAAVDCLDRLGDEWWFERSPPGPGVLVLDVEFV